VYQGLHHSVVQKHYANPSQCGGAVLLWEPQGNFTEFKNKHTVLIINLFYVQEGTTGTQKL
jgi:hypothetical protein